MSNTFDPEAWQDEAPVQTYTNISKTAKISATSTDTAGDIETITQRIEAANVDITQGYDNWLNIAFALSEELGESGRSYFHRVSKFNPGYNQADADKQFDACLKSHKQGITIKSFFQKAKEAGIDLRTREYKSPKSPKCPKSPRRRNGDIGEIGESGDTSTEPLPTFSQLVADRLPFFLKRIADIGESPQETDALILGAITVLSGCLPKIYGVYDDETVYPNLFYFLTARASSGKGRIALCRNLALPIHRRLREAYDQAISVYQMQLAQWEGQDKKSRGPKPEKPRQSMLFIPANTSSTAVYQLLNDNDGKGLIFETEGDTLANAFASDFANFSDGFRKAFHHEPITYHRRANDEDVEIESPQLSTVLTGTPQQVVSLIKDAENGLFSRFIFYRLESKLEWKDVFAFQERKPLNEQFKDWGKEYTEFFDLLMSMPGIQFLFTHEQAQRFFHYFDQLQTQMFSIFKDDILASVRRLGVIFFRIAMIISAIRIMETGDCSEKLVCSDEDFETTLTICQVLVVHTARIFSELSQLDVSKTAGLTTNLKQKAFFNALPDEFDRQDYLAVAKATNIASSTAEKWVRALCYDSGPIERVQHGRYRKKQ